MSAFHANIFPVILTFSSAIWSLTIVNLATLLCIILLWPIMATAIVDSFLGYIAGVFNVFGRPKTARNFVMSTRQDLANWEEAHA